jgi:hypothetical protein
MNNDIASKKIDHAIASCKEKDKLLKHNRALIKKMARYKPEVHRPKQNIWFSVKDIIPDDFLIVQIEHIGPIVYGIKSFGKYKARINRIVPFSIISMHPDGMTRLCITSEYETLKSASYTTIQDSIEKAIVAIIGAETFQLLNPQNRQLSPFLEGIKNSCIFI